MSDDRYLAICAMAADRPGLVAQVTAYVKARGGNIEDSRMNILGGEFGILVLVSGTADAVARIAGETAELEQASGLQVMTRPTRSPAEHRRAAGLPCQVLADALDHPGIVHAVTAGLHAAGVNIVSLVTSAYPAPVTGAPLFRLEARVDAPRGVTVAQLRAHMDSVAAEQSIDIEVHSLVGAAKD